MFHNSTTIWHNPLSQAPTFKEKRMVNFGLGTIWSSMKTGGSVLKTVAGLGWKASYPLRVPGILAWGGIKAGAKSLSFVGKKAKWGAHYGKEVGLGIGKDAIGGSVWELSKAPIMFAWRNLVDNTRDIMKGVFTTPMNILKSPKYLWEGIKGAVGDTRNSMSDLLNETMELNPLGIANQTRKVVQNTLLAPFKAIWNPAKKILETPMNVGKNIGLSIGEYPYRIYKSPTHIRRGVDRVLNAHHTASAQIAKSDMGEEMEKAA